MKKILVVDNNPVILALVSSTLVKQGYEVKTAPSSLAAIKILEKEIPDIIFTDMIMPQINGEQLCRIIRGNSRFDTIPIVIVSGLAKEAAFDPQEIGAVACIAKGPNFTKHILHLLKQLSGNDGRQITSKYIGYNDVFQREISKEMISITKHHNFILNNLDVGVLELTAEDDIVYANAFVMNLFDRCEAELLGLSFVDQFDKIYAEKIQTALGAMHKGAIELDETHAIMVRNRTLTLNFEQINDQLNDTIVVIIHDIDERLQAQKNLKETNDYLQSLINSIQTGVVVIDDESKIIVDVNPVAMQMIGLPRSKIVGQGCNLFICKEDRQQCLVTDCSLCACSSDEVIQHKDGHWIPVVKTSIMQEICGHKFVIVTLTDITPRKRLEEQLRKMSITDELTGIYNRRGFMTLAEQQLKLARRKEISFYLLFADVNDLKKINDTFGHQTGDKALILCAELLKSFRESDIIGRLGGDEFAVLFSANSLASSVKMILRRFNENLQQINDRQELGYELSISTGIVIFDPQNPCSLNNLLSRADTLMYENKMKGKRNR